MNALKKLEKRISKAPGEPSSLVLAYLISSLYVKDDFRLAELYELDYDDFDLAVSLLKDWRLDRFTHSKEQLRKLAGALLARQGRAIL
jgi:hypothetical protein